MAKMNRRNVLIGMGTLVAGGGAALGTGAFSQVEADREVTISVSGDGSALLSFELEKQSADYAGIQSGSDGQAIQIDTNTLNDQATTTFDDVLTVGNSGSQDVNLSITSSHAHVNFYHTSSKSNNLESVDLSITAGQEEHLTLEIDTSQANTDATVEFQATVP